MIEIIDTLYGYAESETTDDTTVVSVQSSHMDSSGINTMSITLPIENLAKHGIRPGDHFKITLTKEGDARPVAKYERIVP